MIRIIVLSLLPISFAWTGAIHYEIMMNAYNKATPIARRFLRHHLGDDVRGIAEAAKWADSEDARARYPQSEEFHFSHTPYRNCSEFVFERDCGFNGSGRCLVTGIAEMVMRATDTRLSLHDRADAIKFLLHLVADIHQPAHTGFAKDAGGVHIQVDVTPKMSLHQLWDFALLHPDVHTETREPSEIQLSKSFESSQDVIDYASLLASESAVLYTCSFAYQTEDGRYIVEGESLDPEYVATGTHIANERMSHAATRLASLLDVLGTKYFEKRTRIVAIPKQGSRVESVDDSNIFAVLELDNAADEIADICEEALQVHSRPSVIQSTPVPAVSHERSEIEVLEDAMARAARDRAAAVSLVDPSHQKNSTVAGVKLSSIVLIKRGALFVMTNRRLLIDDPHYMAPIVSRYKVRFGRKRRNFDFVLDKSLFESKHLSDHDFGRIFWYLKYGEDLPERAGSGFSGSAAEEHFVLKVSDPATPRSMRMDDHLGRRVENGRVLGTPRVDDDLLYSWFEKSHVHRRQWLLDLSKTTDTEEQAVELEFFSKLKSIVIYNVGNVQAYIHKDTLLDDSNVHRRFNLFVSHDPKVGESGLFFLIVDTAIYDGVITPRIQRGMSIVAARKAEGKAVISQSRTFAKEMTDLNKILNTESPKKTQIIKDLVQYHSLIDPRVMKILEWEIHSSG